LNEFNIRQAQPGDQRGAYYVCLKTGDNGRDGEPFYREDPDRNWGPEAQSRLDLFLGSENYDNRIDNGGLFDLEVLADLRRRYGVTLDG